MSFVGMCSFGRTFVPVAHGKGLSAHSTISWTPEAEKAFADKKATRTNHTHIRYTKSKQTIHTDSIYEKNECITYQYINGDFSIHKVLF